VESYQKKKPKLPAHTLGLPSRLSSTPVLSNRIDGQQDMLPPWQPPRPPSAARTRACHGGLLILVTAAERGAGREYGANEPISIEIFFVRCAALLVMAML
jgi:hypothetical protein